LQPKNQPYYPIAGEKDLIRKHNRPLKELSMTITYKQARLTGKLAFLAAAAALGACLGAPAQAAQATANATGTVVTPIAIAAAVDLVFGSFAPGAGGSVTVSTSGVRAATGAILMTGATPSAARFNITGEASTTYSITHSGSATLTSGANSMALAKFSDLSAGNATSGNPATGTLDGAGAQSLYVGGTLTVGAAQAPGVYTGTVIATVEYN
jgi:spore coat protein U-like protein